jgi:predicted RNA-binding Zn-ribbon protein involved in translation (DUF1610 family)
LFRRRFLEELGNAYRAGQLQFFGEYAELGNDKAFARWLAPLKRCKWVVYAKKPFAGPAAVLAYLSRYTHRVAISNQRLIASNEQGVTFRYKDYRAKGHNRRKTMTLSQDEFMRRFLLHVLPSGFHRIRHYGLLANSGRKDNISRARELLHVATTDSQANATIATDEPAQPVFTCPDCGSAMVIVSVFTREALIRAPPWQRVAA